MRTPARRADVNPAAISVPSGLQVYTHQTPEGRTCQSAWAQLRCSCGAYALTWETAAVAWPGGVEHRPDRVWIPDHRLGSARAVTQSHL